MNKKYGLGGIKILKKMDEIFLSVLYPRRCPVCDRPAQAGENICPECRRKVHYIMEPFCLKCGKKLENRRQEYCRDCDRKIHIFSQGRSLYEYEGEIKRSIARFKYQGRQEYAKAYAMEAETKYGRWIKSRKSQVIIPIPLYAGKLKKRGYNQAEAFAEELGKAAGLPVCTDILSRIKDTVPQKELNDRERKNNLQKAFKTKKDIVQLSYILLVDDIYTTGSTMDAAAKALADAGAAQIDFLSISTGSGN